ncbi:gliding motility-associated C-terminal domain-containing protein [Pontibacter chitinilyticus]|uniref:gliding motility-associated C-terminal domain-containing protein n=1 Tax=Pontibacter chitinilyticus TaxID=2674989 RepID=UPI00321A38DB
MNYLLTLYFILGLVPGFSAMARSSTPGCFEAFDTQGKKITTLCVGQEVTFQDCGNKVPDENEYYVFDYKSGSKIPTPSTPEKKHTYTEAGKYRVLQIANYGGATLTDTVSQVYEVKEALPPTLAFTACANRLLHVTVTDKRYDTYTLAFGDGKQQLMKAGQEVSHTYAAEGTFTLTLTGTFAGAPCQGITQQQVTVQGAVPVPKLAKLEVLQQAAAGQLRFTLQNLQSGLRYTLERQQHAGSSFQTIDTLRQVTQAELTYTVADVNTTEAASYRITPTDECLSHLNEVSNTIQSITLASIPAEQEVTLQWTAPPVSVQQTELYRNGSLLQSMAKNTSRYTDTDVSCGQTYTYQVVNTYAAAVQSVSVQQQVAVTSTAIPQAGYLASTFDLDNQLQLSLTLPAGQQTQQVRWEQSIAGGAYKELTTTPQPLFTAATPDILTPTCYRASYTNTCGNSSGFSNSTCPILLQASSAADGSINLSWTKYESFPSGVGQYTVELLSPDKQLLASYAASGTNYTDHTLGNEPLLLYRIKATAKSGVGQTYSNIQTLEQPLLLFVPSAFTPNNDGLNDVLQVKGRFFSNYQIRIYNSLGNVLYDATDPLGGWDGTFKGKQMPAGVYSYDISVTTAAGTPSHRTGTVTLLR